MSDISAHLESLGLAEYTSLFESNDIDLNVLQGMSDADLSSVGISSFGHRRKILASFGGEVSSPSHPAVVAVSEAPSPARKSEELYYESEVELINDGGMAGVRITSRRAILGDKTYSLQNIAAVELFSNSAEIDAYNEQAKTENADSGSKKPISIAVAIGLFIFGLYVSIDGDNLTGMVCCVPVCIGIIIAGFDTSQKALLQPFYTVRIDAAGTATDTIQTLDKEKAQKVVDALNDAIVNLRM